MPYAKRYRGSKRRSFKSRKYPRKRYSSVRTMYKVAKKVVSSNEERKHIDVDLGTHVNVNWNGIYRQLAPLFQGNTDITRIGTKVKGKGLGLRITFESNLLMSSDVTEWRVIIGYGHNELGTTMSSSVVLQYPASEQATHSPYAYNSSSKYTILKDDRFWTDKTNKPVAQRNYFFRLKDLVTTYSEGAVNTYANKGLFMFIWNSVDPLEANEPGISGICRYYYTDA